LKKHGRETDEQVVDFLLGVFLQHDVPRDAREKLLTYLAGSKAAKTPVYWTTDDVVHHRLRTVTHLTLTLPEFQLN